MTSGLILPVDNDAPASGIQINGIHTRRRVLELLDSDRLVEHLLPTPGLAILASYACETDGSAVNRRATDLLWKIYPPAFLKQMVYGTAVVVGYKSPVGFVDVPPHFARALNAIEEFTPSADVQQLRVV